MEVEATVVSFHCKNCKTCVSELKNHAWEQFSFTQTGVSQHSQYGGGGDCTWVACLGGGLENRGRSSPRRFWMLIGFTSEHCNLMPSAFLDIQKSVICRALQDLERSVRRMILDCEYCGRHNCPHAAFARCLRIGVQ
jgi:hypothetical protein